MFTYFPLLAFAIDCKPDQMMRFAPPSNAASMSSFPSSISYKVSVRKVSDTIAITHALLDHMRPERRHDAESL